MWMRVDTADMVSEAWLRHLRKPRVLTLDPRRWRIEDSRRTYESPFPPTYDSPPS